MYDSICHLLSNLCILLCPHLIYACYMIMSLQYFSRNIYSCIIKYIILLLVYWGDRDCVHIIEQYTP